MIPPPSSIESHFRGEVIERENILLNCNLINQLLNQYFIYIHQWGV